MRGFLRTAGIMLAVCICCACLAAAAAADEPVPPGRVDLSRLTYKELLAFQNDIDAEYKLNHTPTDAQAEFVLSATKAEAQKYYAKKGLEISGWAWYDSEYTYTRDWDFYTLTTHLDYRDSSRDSHQAKIYSEAWYRDGRFVLTYLRNDSTTVLDNRSEYDGIRWFREPNARISRETGIDLSGYTAQQLLELYNKADRQIEASHSVSQSEQNTILGYTKLELEQYLLEKGFELRGYAWYDSEYTYTRDWDYYWLETHVDYRNSSGSSKTDKLFSEFCKISGELELVYLKMGSAVIIDRRNELAAATEDGIPRYSWAGSAEAGSAGEAESAQAETAAEGEQAEETETGSAGEATADRNLPEEDGEGVYISFGSATDEELEEAVQKIRAEQRARLKTKIVLSEESLSLVKGKVARLTAEVTGIPEGHKASKITWATSDKNTAACQNGTVTGRENGQATITASCTLTDGTEVTGECTVTVYTPVKSLQAGKKEISIGVGERASAEVTVQPKDATNTALKWESSNPSAVSVSSDGTVTGQGAGTATITASTTDGSGKEVSFRVTCTRKDDRGKTLTNSEGVALTVLDVRQTKGSGFAEADAGNIFVLVELQIENNSTGEVSVNSTFGFEAYCDDYSVDYSFSAEMNTKSSITTTDLKPGKRLKGWKGFEVPQNWKELVIRFTPDASVWGSGEKIEFVLYNSK